MAGGRVHVGRAMVVTGLTLVVSVTPAHFGRHAIAVAARRQIAVLLNAIAAHGLHCVLCGRSRNLRVRLRRGRDEPPMVFGWHSLGKTPSG
jgi:hypothetical protein